MGLFAELAKASDAVPVADLAERLGASPELLGRSCMQLTVSDIC